MNISKYTISKKERSMEINDAVLTLSEPDKARLEWPLNRRVFSVFLGISLFVLVLYLGRFTYLNVVKGSLYQDMSLHNSIRSIVIPAPRGIIKDRFGKELVNNIPSVDLVLTPIDVPTDDSAVAKLKQGLVALGLDAQVVDDTFAHLDRHSPKQVLLKQNLSQDESLIFLEHSSDLPGVTLLKTTKRNYVNGQVFAHIIGYEGKIQPTELTEHPDYLLTDTVGKQGIEKSYDTELRGQHGYQQGEIDAQGRIKKDLGIIQPIAGNDLVLNIDAGLQQEITDELLQQLPKAGVTKAAAVAIDPRNGAVRALVSIPSFDNNLFAKGISNDDYAKLANDPTQPLFDRAISGEYAPGSTIKPLHAVAALAEHIIDPLTQIESRGGIQVGNFFFGDWRVNGFTDIRRAIAVSSDVYFYTVGGGYGGIPGLGIARMKHYDSLFGYGKPTGIDIPGEASGFLPDAEWKQKQYGERWYVGDDYNSAIGQGYITTTALQIARAITAIANGGTLYTPQVVHSEVDSQSGQEQVKEPEVANRNFVSPDIIKIVQEGMRETVTEGTAQPLKDLPVEVAGKTGTAQFGADGRTHGWFVSYAPYQNPELAVVVLFEGQTGDETYNGVPVTKAIYQWYFSDEQVKKRQEGSDKP